MELHLSKQSWASLVLFTGRKVISNINMQGIGQWPVLLLWLVCSNIPSVASLLQPPLLLSNHHGCCCCCCWLLLLPYVCHCEGKYFTWKRRHRDFTQLPATRNTYSHNPLSRTMAAIHHSHVFLLQYIVVLETVTTCLSYILAKWDLTGIPLLPTCPYINVTWRSIIAHPPPTAPSLHNIPH